MNVLGIPELCDTKDYLLLRCEITAIFGLVLIYLIKTKELTYCPLLHRPERTVKDKLINKNIRLKRFKSILTY